MNHPTTQIPPGHHGITALQQALHIGSTTLQRNMQNGNFPAPAGYYISKGSCRRTYPYYNLNAVKRFINDPTAASEQQEPTELTGWVTPRHSHRQKNICLQTRQFIQRVFKPKHGTDHAKI